MLRFSTSSTRPIGALAASCSTAPTFGASVTLSDLQRLPVRTALFGLFIHLELLLTETLRDALEACEMPFEQLSDDRALAPRHRWEGVKSAGMDRDPFEALSFGDEKTTAKKAKLFGLSGKRIDHELEAVEKDLRDPIAHGLTFAASEEQARKVSRPPGSFETGSRCAGGAPG